MKIAVNELLAIKLEIISIVAWQTSLVMGSTINIHSSNQWGMWFHKVLISSLLTGNHLHSSSLKTLVTVAWAGIEPAT